MTSPLELNLTSSYTILLQVFFSFIRGLDIGVYSLQTADSSVYRFPGFEMASDPDDWRQPEKPQLREVAEVLALDGLFDRASTI